VTTVVAGEDIMTDLHTFTDRRRFPDPAKRWTLTKRAMRLYLTFTGEKERADNHDYVEWIEALPKVTSEYEYEDRLNTVRNYAVEECERSVNCEEGTNKFLNTFGLKMFEPVTQKCIMVTVTVHFHVNNEADIDATKHDVEHYLRIELGGNVDDADFDDADFDIDNVTVSID
jgi:hypothetical protein